MNNLQLLEGRPPALELRARHHETLDRIRWDHGDMEIAILSVSGESTADTYIRSIKRTFARYKVPVNKHEFNRHDDPAAVHEHLRALQTDPRLHGILVLKPLPDSFAIHLRGRRRLPLLAAVQNHVDLECISSRRIMDIALGYGELAPPTAGAVLRILDYYQIPIEGKHVVVIGRSSNVGRPAGWLLMRRNATVSVCHSRTPKDHLVELTSHADIIVTATGRPRSITADMVKPGAVVIDAGFEYLDGEPVGDVDFDGVSALASAITPVPGGLGPLTNEVLVNNLVVLAEERYANSETE